MLIPVFPNPSHYEGFFERSNSEVGQDNELEWMQKVTNEAALSGHCLKMVNRVA